MDIQEYEIMAPVGSRESLAAAIQAGAGSIYFGIGQLNMRSHSANHFTIEDLKEIAETCNERGIKTYLTVNTVIYGEDINAMREIIDAAKAANITAVIVSDVAVMVYCRQVGMEVHLSTQLNISNIEALKFYAQFADVAVLARELNMEQVAEIYRQIEEQDIRGPRGIGAHRNVLPRCFLYGYFGQVLHESARLEPLCQPWTMHTDLPPFVHRYRQRNG